MSAQRLRMIGVNNTADDVVLANIRATLSRKYEPLVERKDGIGRPVSIVGAGPSLAWTYKDLVGDVIACNSAHDFLISKGIVPKYAMLWDAHPVISGIVSTPHKDVTYLVASRCHPSVFEKLRGYKVVVFHALGDGCLQKLLIEYKRNEPMVAGGSSSVTRATHVAGCLGYTKEMHLFGIDSCYSESRSHVAGSLAKLDQFTIRVCGKWFTVSPWMALQAEDFKTLAPLLKGNGIRLIVHGTGLIPYVATFLGIEAPDVKVTLYERMRRHLHTATLVYLEFRKTPQLLGGSNHARV